MKKNIQKFFEKLEIWEDINNQKNYKYEIKQAILHFMDNPTENSAMNIYSNFFKAYWIGTQDDKNPFLEMIEKMKQYEQSGGQVILSQRDHLIHSVNVFILGLCIYTENPKMTLIFNDYIKNSQYQNSYTTNNEEFFYRWGITSLFHDIAYPMEILLKQLKEYSKFLNSYTITDDDLKLAVKFDNFDRFITLPTLKIKQQYKEEFLSRNPKLNLNDYTSCIYIFAKNISNAFNIKQDDIINELNKNIQRMENGEYIDHGFYSGIIVLKWYHSLIYKTNWDPSYFIYPITEVATNILLHNYYSHGLMNNPFNLGKLEFNSSPLAYLLILCDELQEWDRIRFSDKSIDTQATISICGSDIEIIYDSCEKKLNEKFAKIDNILNLSNILNLNIKVINEGGEKYE